LWEEVTSKKVKKGKAVNFYIEHFSKYAIS